jgi:hypothetical protein
MEITCHRCHQTVEAENCYCPACGLPQLQYTADGAAGQPQSEQEDGQERDAGCVNWKPALRAALLLAVPAGILSSERSPVSGLGLLWMSAAAAWTVALYVRRQQPAWITLGVGARIGMVTGLLGGWLAFGVSGGALFVERYLLHQSSRIDAEWKIAVDFNQQMVQQAASGMSQADAAQWQAICAPILAFMLKPEGHAGWLVFFLVRNSLFLIFFAVVGGALGARLMARSRRPEI